MTEVCQNSSLPWGDAFFLYLEREGQPLNIASVSDFEGTIALPAFIRFVESKLHLIPRYLQRAVSPPFNVGLPVWELDPAFDIRNHIRQVTLKAGTDADLKVLAGKLVSLRMDREHPLWDLTLVRGLVGNRSGLIVRIHHCMADGIAGVGVVNVLMDPSPIPPKIGRKKRRPPAPPRKDPGAEWLDGLVRSYSSILQGAVAAHSEVMNLAQQLLAGAGNGTAVDLIKLVPELGTPAVRLPFNQVCRGPQHVAWAEIPMAEIKSIRTSLGGTVNDVILTVITAAFRRYAELHDVDLRGRQLRIVVPVNVRGKSDASELGNQITFLPIDTPLDVPHPRELLANVSQRMTFLRSAGVAELVGLAGGLISRIPLPVQALLAPIASQLPLSVCNTICTNIPGPQIPLYLIGHRMLRWYPYVPIGGEMGINVAILSYDGNAYIGFSGDVHAAPDLVRMEKFVSTSFAELKTAAAEAQASHPESPDSGDQEEKAQPPKAAKPAARTAKPARAATNRPAPVAKLDRRKRKGNGSLAVARPKRRAAAASGQSAPTDDRAPVSSAAAEPTEELAHAGD